MINLTKAKKIDNWSRLTMTIEFLIGTENHRFGIFYKVRKIFPSYHRNQFRNSLNIQLHNNIRNMIHAYDTIQSCHFYLSLYVRNNKQIETTKKSYRSNTTVRTYHNLKREN